MRISDWSSDVCSSDLIQGIDETRCQAQGDTHRIGLHMSAPPQHHEYAAAYGKNRSQPPARPGRFTGDGNLKQAGPDWTASQGQGRADGDNRGFDTRQKSTVVYRHEPARPTNPVPRQHAQLTGKGHGSGNSPPEGH